MKIFLDIGAHHGQTLQEVIKPKYGFDEIHAFEPVPSNCDIIQETCKDKRVIVNEFGLLDCICHRKIYAAGSMGGSIFEERFANGKSKEELPDTLCTFCDASLWFSTHLSEDDYVIVKINTEGSEIAIIYDLLSTGVYDLLNHILIDFDVRKISSREHLKKQAIGILRAMGKNNFTDEQAMRGKGDTHQERIAAWLDSIGE